MFRKIHPAKWNSSIDTKPVFGHLYFLFLFSIVFVSCTGTTIEEQEIRQPFLTDTPVGKSPLVTETLHAALGGETGEVGTSVIEIEDGSFLIAGYEYKNLNGDWDSLVMRVSANGELLWRKSSGQRGDDYAWVVRQAGENLYVVVGTRTTSNGDTDGYVDAIDNEGNVIWSNNYGGSGDELFWGAERTADDGFFLIGQTDSEGAGGFDFYVVRIDTEGRVLWSNTYGGADIDRAFGIAQTPEAGAILVGFQGANPSNMDIFVLQIDENGRELWRQAFGGNGFDVAHDIARVANGGYVISGYSDSWSPRDQDGFLMKISEDGRLLWIKTYGNTDEDRILHVAPTQEGGFALIGYSKTGTGENWDLVIWRTDENGELLWSRRVGGNKPDQGKDVIFTRDGSIVVAGGTRSEQPPYDDVILLRFLESTTSDQTAE